VVFIAGSLLLYILSIFSKETAIAAFPVFFMLIFVKIIQSKQKFTQSIQLYAKAYIVACASIVVVGIYMLLRLTILNFSNVFNYYSVQNEYSTHLVIRLFTFAKVLWIYLGILLWPNPLHMERSVSIVTSFFAWQVWGILLVIGAVLFLSIWEVRKNKTAIILFGFVLSASLLIPVSGIVPINGILYEHWLYIPSIGLWLIAYGLLYLGYKKLPIAIRHRLYAILISFAILLASLYIVLTIRQNNIWSDPVTFYTYTLSFAPDSARLHNNLGMSLSDKGQNQEAIAEYKKALALGQDYPQIYNNLGNAEIATGQYKDAEINLKKALQLSPGFTVAKQNFLKLYLLSKQYNKARELSGNNANVERLILQLEKK
jgi:tetratricopeptide (TPR) repeat protein